MGITLFTPFFLLFVLYACLGERQWVMATLIAAFLQAASPLLLAGGGRITGIQTAYALLPIGVMHLVLSEIRRARGAGGTAAGDSSVWGIDSADALMLGLTAIGVVGAVLLPRVLKGVVMVLPPSVGYHPEPLKPSGRNIIQAFYMACNCLLYVLVSRSVMRGVVTVSQCIRALAVGTGFAIVLGLYQVAGTFAPLPWPAGVINSNLGVTQLYNQGAYGIRRMSSTFLEPSILAMHFVGLFALFGLGLRRWWLGGALLFCLLISTSATAYLGLGLLVMLYLVFAASRMTLGVASAFMLTAAVGCMGALLIVGILGVDQLPGATFIMRKLASHSGSVRTAADAVNLQAIRDSWGLGTGIGSTRSSSFVATFAACTGLPGVVCLVGFFATLIVRGARSAATDARALALALGALTLGWLTSVPDLTLALVWLLAGLTRAATAETVSTESRAASSYARDPHIGTQGLPA